MVHTILSIFSQGLSTVIEICKLELNRSNTSSPGEGEELQLNVLELWVLHTVFTPHIDQQS